MTNRTISDKHVYFTTKDLAEILELNPRTIISKIKNNEIIGYMTSRRKGYIIKYEDLVHYIKTLDTEKQKDFIQRIKDVRNRLYIEHANDFGIHGDTPKEILDEITKMVKKEINQIFTSPNKSLSSKTIKNPILKDVFSIIEKSPATLCDTTLTALDEPECSSLEVSPLNEKVKDLLASKMEEQSICLQKIKQKLHSEKDVLSMAIANKNKEIDDNDNKIKKIENRLKHLNS